MQYPWSTGIDLEAQKKLDQKNDPTLEINAFKGGGIGKKLVKPLPKFQIFTKFLIFNGNLYRSINNKNPPSISNNKNSRKNPEGIFRIIRRRGKFSFGDFENNKSSPQAKIFRGILGLYQGGNGNFV